MDELTRVLIVDDNQDQTYLVCEFLRSAGSFAVDVAVDLQGLWDHLASQPYDVILLDYSLPDGNGLEALDEFPARGYDVPVVMVTGRGDERVATRAIQRGAIDYLVKGGDYFRTLPALVEKAVRAHRLELSARRSLEQIRYQALLLDNVRDAVVVWDLEGHITFWNQAAEALFEWSTAERLGRSVTDCYLEAFTPPVELPPGNAPASTGVERQGRRKTGGLIWVSSCVTPLHDGQGRRMGYMDVSRDVTARKRLESQIQAAYVHLTQAARLTAIGELASGVAHQISNPLTTVIGEAQILLHRLKSEHPARESAEAIERAGWRAQDAVQRLLDFSRPASSTLESLSINDTIERALALVGAHIESSGVTLQLDLARGLPPVHGNARQLEDLWVNLLLVARDAISRDRVAHDAVARGAVARGAMADSHPHRIQLRSEAGPENLVVVTVSDDGEVIPPAQLATIFEPGFTGPTSGRGSGMELSICREIVRQHRGQIAADSAPGRGTIFTITLPPEVQP